MIKKILLTLFVLVALAAGGGYFLFLKFITPEDLPAKVMNAEEVVTTKGTIAIASVDMTYIRRIEDLFKQMKDPSVLPAPKSTKVAAEKTLLDKLNSSGVHLFANTDFGLAAINVADKKPAYTVVLFGRFSKEKIKRAIGQDYVIDESTANYWLISKDAEQEKKIDPCSVKATVKTAANNSAPQQQALHIQSDRILLSSAELMPVLLKRFSANARAEVSLTKWREFRKEKAVAGAFMTPKAANKGALDLPSALLLGALSKQPLQELYAGAVVKLIPEPGFTLLVDAHANDAAWPLEVKTNFDTSVKESVTDLEGMPTLIALIKTLNLEAKGNILHFKTTANKKTLDNLERVPGEFLQMAFSGVFDSQETGPAGEEQIVNDSEVEKYKPQFAFSSVKPFDGKNIFHMPDVVEGPFGLRLKKMGLFATDDSVIELTITADGKGFENLPAELMHQSDKLPAAGLSISSVEDIEGNNLLREEQCGKEPNFKVTSLQTTRDKEFVDGQWITKSLKVSGDKSVRLRQNTLLAQVAKIKGKIELRAATKTRTQSLRPPFARKVVETDKVRMYFRKGSHGTVSYNLSGDLSQILAIRAKNANGQYLSSGSSSSFGDETKMVSKRFKGKVASVEVIVAEQMETKEYPFELKQVAPRYGKKGDGKEVAMTFTTKSRFLRDHRRVKHKDECKDKQKVESGAFLICLNKFGDRFGRETGGEFDVIGPYEEALRNDLSAVKLSIDSVQTESGEKIPFDKNEKASFVYKFGTNYNEKKKDWEIINRRMHASNVSLYSDKEELKGKKVSTINGTLTLRLPKQPTSLELPADKLGIFKKTKNGITANISAFEDWGTYIDIQGPAEKVLRFVPLAADKTILNTGNDRINEKQYITWGLSNADKEKVKSLPKRQVGMITIYGKPEVIRVFYADEFDVIKQPFSINVTE